MSRKKGDGCFRKLPNGTVEFIATIPSDLYGSRQRKRFYGKNEAECRRKYKEYLKEGEKQPAQSKEHTLSSWLDLWLTTYKEQKVEGSTYADYLNLAAHAKQHKIGSMKLSQIRPIHITEFFTGIISYSHSFRKRMRFLLNGAFETAIDNDLTDKNPVRRAEIASKQQPEKESYSESEASIIVNFAKTDEKFGIPMFIMMNTGIRSGEMRALTTDSISFQEEGGIVSINRAIKRTGEIGLPKNNKPRHIPLEEEVAEFLQLKLQGKSGYVIGGDYYVTHSGFRGRYECFFNRLNIHLESQGLKPIPLKSPHSTRHANVKPATKEI